ncbi:tail fiber protein [Gallibacterium salpingitidis]|uniref:tail fiber protein n=1 Tax=Gallibacterium salpingitidis TaxID=505341 RepID=UPI00083110F1|nr:tail fiber protein [Gallibacterium salpingitidis]
MNTPKLISKTWAENGLKNSIPNDREVGFSDERATYEEGFPSITMTPIAQGGKAPSGKDMNGILHEITAHIVFQNKGGTYQFNQDFANEIGGYERGSILISDDYTTVFVSLVDNNTLNFNTAEDYSRYWSVIATTGVAPKDLDETSESITDKAGHSHKLPIATLFAKGITSLYSGYDLAREDLAATPKAINTLKAFIDALASNQQNYIPNSKKSNSLTSPSADNVATSYAVNQIYSAVVALFNGDRSGFQSIVNSWGVSGITPLGVSYDFTNPNAWWIKFGPLYGNLIIQGGLINVTGTARWYNYPITMSKRLCVIIGAATSQEWGVVDSVLSDTSKFQARKTNDSSGTNYWYAIIGA